MTLGKYPSGVRQIPHLPVGFASSDTSRFVDIAPPLASTRFPMPVVSSSMISTTTVLLDIVTSSYDQCEPLHLFHNNGDGTHRSPAGGRSIRPAGRLNLIQTDYNNDGCLDIFVLRAVAAGDAQFPAAQ